MRRQDAAGAPRAAGEAGLGLGDGVLTEGRGHFTPAVAHDEHVAALSAVGRHLEYTVYSIQ